MNLRLHIYVLIIFSVFAGVARAAEIDFTPELYFPESCPGSTNTMMITIKNPNPWTIKIFRNPLIVGSNPEFFSFVANPLLGNDIDLPEYVNGENALNIEIKFKYPKNDTSTKSAELVINTDFKEQQELRIKLFGSSTNTLYTYNPYNIDLGTVQAGKSYRDTVNFTNLGYEPVRLDSVLLGTKKLNFYERNLNAKDTAQIPLEFSFQTEGEVFSSVRIFMNSICRDTMVLPFHAKVDGSVFSVTDNLNFGDTVVCGAKTLSAVFKPGAGPLTLKSISPIDGPNAGVFSIINPPATPFSTPKEGYSLDVRYEPSEDLKYGSQSANFILTFDDGTGLQDVQVNLTGFVWKDSLNSEAIDFGGVFVGKQAGKPINISNGSKYPIVIDSVVLLSGSRGFSLNAEGLRDVTLPPASNTSSSVYFKSMEQGVFRDTARIYYSYLDCKLTYDVDLSANAYGSANIRIWTETPTATVDPKTNDFTVIVKAESSPDSDLESLYALEKVEVSLPRDLLYFKSVEEGQASEVNLGADRCDVTIIPDITKATDTTIIAKLTCIPLLGSVESDSVYVKSATVSYNLDSIKVTLAGSKIDLIYCDKGGKRLLSRNKFKPDLVCSPNSSDGLLSVKFNATELGEHRLDAYGVAGDRVFSKSFDCVARGQSFEFNLNELPAGLYLIIVEAPTDRFISKALKAGF